MALEGIVLDQEEQLETEVLIIIRLLMEELDY